MISFISSQTTCILTLEGLGGLDLIHSNFSLFSSCTFILLKDNLNINHGFISELAKRA